MKDIDFARRVESLRDDTRRPLVADPVGAFRQAMREAGVQPPPKIVGDGEIHRFRADGDKPGARSGWYVLHLDEWPAGRFGDWRTLPPPGFSWSAKAGRRMSQAQRRRFQRKKAERRRQREKEERERRTKARKKAAEMLRQSGPADPAHPYLQAKGVGAHEIRQLGDTLLVPVNGPDGSLRGLQRIRPDGSKRFLVGTEVSGGYFPVGEKPEGTLLVAEGFATAATLHETTGHAVACAFNCGNLQPVAGALRKKLPDVRIILAADNDHQTDGNPGLLAATEAAQAVNGLLAVPAFEDGEEGTDFNDLVSLRGADVVREAIDGAVSPSSEALETLQSGAASAQTRQTNSGRPGPQIHMVCAADIEPEEVRWLWPGRIPLGKLTILDGDPGLGKSVLTIDLAARLSVGGPMPDGVPAELDGPSGALFLVSEDGMADTWRPRLDAAGADVKRVRALRAVGTEDGDDRIPTVEDAGALELAIRQADARLLVVDSLMAYLGRDVNSYRDQDVRSALVGLAELAESSGVAVLLIRHLNKNSGGNPLYRGGGSIGLIAAARSGLLVAKDPEDPEGSRRILAFTKSNLAAAPPSLAYRLEPVDGTVRVAWEGQTDHTASALLSVPDAEEQSRLEEAVEFLEAELERDPVASSELQKRAEIAGLAWRTVHRASNQMSVEKEKEGFGSNGRCVWRLPYNYHVGSLGVANAEEARQDEGSPEDAKAREGFGRIGGVRSPKDANEGGGPGRIGDGPSGRGHPGGSGSYRANAAKKGGSGLPPDLDTDLSDALGRS